MEKETKIPYIGYHGLMRISCGKNKLDLAFFIRDYLLSAPISDFIRESFDNGESLFDVIQILPIPEWALRSIIGYQTTALNIKKAEKELAELLIRFRLLTKKNHTFIQDRSELKKGSDKIFKGLKNIEKQVDMLSSIK